MNIFKIVTLLAFIFSGSIICVCQTNYPQNYFQSPLGITLELSGTFGEPRSDHFHTGDDFRTMGKEGLPVYASAGGYISRIKVSAYGYGNVLYITHPNGYMTVYGHLKKFNDDIQQWVKQQQYLKQSFEVDLYPPSSLFKVAQGDIIALSGNSGSSQAPHLHFEIRDANGESTPLNPQLFGLTPTDYLFPVFNSLEIYSYYSSQQIISQPKSFDVIEFGENTFYPTELITVNNPKVAFGSEVIDYGVSNGPDYGIYSMKTTVDSNTVFSFQIDRLDFAAGRYANAEIDYEWKQEHNDLLYRSFVLPGNNSAIYTAKPNNGWITLTDTLQHEVVITASDFYGNVSKLYFYIKYQPAEIKEPAPASKTFFDWSKDNTFTNDSIQLNFPQGLFYENFWFQFSQQNSTTSVYKSSKFQVHNTSMPVHDYYEIKILPRSISPSYKNKTIIAFSKNGNSYTGKTTTWDGQWLSCKAREFGNFVVMIDTLAPTIKIVSGKNGQAANTGTHFVFNMHDSLSGITSYNGYVDGHWILLEHDGKNDNITYTVENDLLGGEHILEIVVEDEVGNQKTLKFKFNT